MAREWLDNQIENRNLRLMKVRQYQAEFESGKWTADPLLPLLFNLNGQLADGQHRLRAVIEFNRPVLFYVRTVEDQLLNAIANTLPRTMRDRLEMIGAKNSTALASVSHALLQRRELGALQLRHQACSRSWTPDDFVGVIAEILKDGTTYASVEDFMCDSEKIYRLQPSRVKLLSPKHIGYLLAQTPEVRSLLVKVCNEEAQQNDESRCIRKHLLNFITPTNVHHWPIFVVSRTFNHGPQKLYRFSGARIEDLRGSVFERIWPAE
jgi:hypothetical protein